MAIGDIWRLAFAGTFQGQEVVNIWHIKFLSVGASVSGATSYLNTNFYQSLKTRQSGDMLGYSVHGVQLSDTQPTYDGTITANGTGVADPLASQIAMVVSLKTGYAGRSKRGRLYLSGWMEDNSSSGQVAAADLAGVQGYFTTLVAALGLGGSDTDYQWGIWSRKLGGDTPPYNLAAGWTPITSATVRGVWGTQRRRRLGVGA